MIDVTNSPQETKGFVNVDVEWKEAICCQWVDKQLRMGDKEMQACIDDYTYVLQLGGSATVNYKRKEVQLHKHDMMLFPPQTAPSLSNVSDDYCAICLILSTQFCNSNILARRSFLTSFYHFNSLEAPLVHTSKEQALMLEADLRLLIYHIKHPNSQTYSTLECLYGVFLSDLLAILNDSNGLIKQPNRAQEIFQGFADLLKKDFKEEHSVNYYADKLNISQRYLAMAVREVNNQSVTYFINQMLIIEACWLLKSTTFNVQQITDKLHFSESTVFCKFFKRHTGMSPLAYRENEQDEPSNGPTSK